MDHDWVGTSFGSTVNLNGDAFDEPGWTCRNCGLTVLFSSPSSSMYRLNWEPLVSIDVIIGDPGPSRGLDAVGRLAEAYGAPDCDAQTVRYVMMS